MEGLENAQVALPDADSHHQISVIESGYSSTTDVENTSYDATFDTQVVSANARNGTTTLPVAFGSIQIEDSGTSLINRPTLESGYSSSHEGVETQTNRSVNPTLAVDNYNTTLVATTPAGQPQDNVMPSQGFYDEQESPSQENSPEIHGANDQTLQNIPEVPPPLNSWDPDIAEITEGSRFLEDISEITEGSRFLEDIAEITEGSRFLEEFQPVEESWGRVSQESENEDDFDVNMDVMVSRAAYRSTFSQDNMDIDVDIAMMRHLRRTGWLPLPRICLSCFQFPVAVQNLPCGCICNCMRCAPLMRYCARCHHTIRHYMHLN